VLLQTKSLWIPNPPPGILERVSQRIILTINRVVLVSLFVLLSLRKTVLFYCPAYYIYCIHNLFSPIFCQSHLFLQRPFLGGEGPGAGPRQQLHIPQLRPRGPRLCRRQRPAAPTPPRLVSSRAGTRGLNTHQIISGEVLICVRCKSS